MQIKMNMKYWWNDADREKPKYLAKNLSYCDIVYHKSHID
jgi:hypothetical protein